MTRHMAAITLSGQLRVPCIRATLEQWQYIKWSVIGQLGNVGYYLYIPDAYCWLVRVSRDSSSHAIANHLRNIEYSTCMLVKI